MAWSARRGIRRKSTSRHVSTLIECLAEAANLEVPGSGDGLRQRKLGILLSCHENRHRIGRESKALDDIEWQRLLSAARREVDMMIRDYQPGDVPVSGIALVPFMVLVAAYTGANTTPLLAFKRKSWTPAPVLEGYWSVKWRKDRAKGHEQQNLIFPRKVIEGPSLIEILDFVQTWTAPLIERVPENCRNDLWLHQSRHRSARSAALGPIGFLRHHAMSWMHKHSLRSNMDCIRSNAAITLLRSGKTLTNVQHFLQHAEIVTTWRYLRSAVLRPVFNSVIAATQERILGRVVPQPRAVGATTIETSPAVHAALVSGSWDLGTCACRDPYRSPMPGEITGRLCRSFHACYTCPHGVWFKEHLPLEVWKLSRLESLRTSDPHWSQKYQTTCEIIRRDILGEFSAEECAWAEREASAFGPLPILAAWGVTL